MLSYNFLDFGLILASLQNYGLIITNNANDSRKNRQPMIAPRLKIFSPIMNEPT
jgi:hypothetical protein